VSEGWKLVGLVGSVLLLAGAATKPESAQEQPTGWVRVDYGAIVDRRQLTHSGEPVGAILKKLAGRPFPEPGERPEDLLSYRLLEPLLDPYGFVLPDALDSVGPAPDPPWIEIGWLFQPGQEQPAWADLLRSRRLVVESDGRGRFRIFLPWKPRSGSKPSVSLASVPSRVAAEEAWHEWWPVLRHVFAAEKRRLDRARGIEPEERGLEVTVHPFVHERALTAFHLGRDPYRTVVASSRPARGTVPMDLRALDPFLSGGQRLEGARLEPDGTLVLFGSRPASRSGLFGGPLLLSDFAVAYRAVFYGGTSEPYMSLDRDISPWSSLVTYGGRLEDTRLGLVSLLCDIRFKTFSLGLDVLTREDLRRRLRGEIPSFRTHLERIAEDPAARGFAGQQTRLWFYPDDVEITLSAGGDLFALRRARMTASSERMVVGATLEAASEPEPRWTTDTVSAINADYDRLARLLPELSDLDEVVRLLAFFTWLEQAKAHGLVLPDLDALLGSVLPAFPTPRRLPNLLVYVALPGTEAGAGEVELLDRVAIAEAFARLEPRVGGPLPARRRLERALGALDRRIGEQAALAREIEERQSAGELDEAEADLLAYRAERLLMHQRVLSALDAASRETIEARRGREPGLRALSVAIGGVDLGMGQALARARGRPLRLAERSRSGEAVGRRTGGGGPAPAAGTGEPKETAEPEEALPPVLLPDHGLDPSAKPENLTLEEGGRATVVRTEFGDHWVRKILWSSARADREGSVLEVALGVSSPELRLRRRVADAAGREPTIERIEGERAFRYALVSGGDGRALRAEPRPDPALPPEIREPFGRFRKEAADRSQRRAVPPGLAVLEVGEGRRPSPSAPPKATDSGTRAPESAAIPLRVERSGEKPLEAIFPRQVLERLVLGREADLSPGRPLPGLEPPATVLGSATTLMVVQDPVSARFPWSGSFEPVPGEEDGARIAEALGRWWRAQGGGGGAPPVVVGTDLERSPARWQAAPRVSGKALLLLPNEAFPGLAAPWRSHLAARWPPKQIASSLPSRSLPELVVLASAEAPGLLGARVRSLARADAMRGRLLAVCSLSGPLRADLPAMVLAEGSLAGLGIAEFSLVDWRDLPSALEAFSRALVSKAARGRRIEELPSPFLWYW